MKNVGKIIWIVAMIAIIVLIGVVGFGYYKKATFKSQNPVATMEVENFGTIKMELYPDQAPEAVANFIKLANNGFYDETTFHRIVKDFNHVIEDKRFTHNIAITHCNEFKPSIESKYYSDNPFEAKENK